MSWTTYLVPRVVGNFSSPYNRDIRILEEKGKNKLLVNGSRQSGDYIRMLWQHAFCKFGIIPSPDVRSILVLGIAGGTVIELTHAIYPDAIITGVDIDAQMVDIGKKYFGLGRVHGLTCIIADAQEYVRTAVAEKKQWDMVIVDLFIGATIPEFVYQNEFIRRLKRIVTPRGELVINYLRELQYLTLSARYRATLKKYFPRVEETDIYYNRFFCCRHA
jgi:spermidine synthase